MNYHDIQFLARAMHGDGQTRWSSKRGATFLVLVPPPRAKKAALRLVTQSGFFLTWSQS